MDEPKLFPAWRQAAKEFIEAAFSDGEIIPKSWFEKAFDMPPITGKMTQEELNNRQLKWLSAITDLRDFILENHAIYLHTVQGQGYMLVPPKDQTRIAQEKYEREAKASYKQASLRLKHVRFSELTDEQRRENMDAIAKLSMLRGMQKGALSNE